MIIEAIQYTYNEITLLKKHVTSQYLCNIKNMLHGI